MMQIEILPNPTAVDFQQLGDLLRDSVAGGASVNFIEVPTNEEAIAWWRNALTDEFDSLLVARVDGQIVGCVRLMPAPQPNGPHRADIGKLLVHSNFRGQGIASRLMEAVEQLAKQQGRWLLILDTETGSYAEGFYRGRGWIEFGKVPNHTYDPTGQLSATTYFLKELR